MLHFNKAEKMEHTPLLNWAGLVPYRQSLVLQDNAVNSILSNFGSSTLLGMEHPSVITLGKRGSQAIDVCESEAALSLSNVELYISDRGGQATLHSRGQLVIYPICRLSTLKVGVRDYVDGLQEATLSFLSEYGVSAFRMEGRPGVYTSRGKIAFFGVRVSRGITSHGVSINISNDLNLFRFIRSCGQSQETFDRLTEYVPNALPEHVYSKWSRHFCKTFNLTSSPETISLK